MRLSSSPPLDALAAKHSRSKILTDETGVIDRRRFLQSQFAFLATLIAGVCHGQDTSPPPVRLLLLLPDSPFSQQRAELEARFLRLVGAQGHEVCLLGDTLLGPMGNDPGAWKQGCAFMRTAIHFLHGRQQLDGGQFDAGVGSLSLCLRALGEGGLLAKPPLLASISLLEAQLAQQMNQLVQADAAYRFAASVDPDDNSSTLPIGPYRERYLAARREIQEAPRLPVSIDASIPNVQLYVDGTIVQGKGPRWIVELPPGKHYACGIAKDHRPAGQWFFLAPKSPTPTIHLRIEPGTGAPASFRPFTLGEARDVQAAITSLLQLKNLSEALIALYREPTTSTLLLPNVPVVGIPLQLTTNPGPSEPIEMARPKNLELEIFHFRQEKWSIFLGL